MNPTALSPELRSAAPALGARLGGAILLPLAALIAHAFLRNPLRVGIITLLWTRLKRAAARFDRLMARVAAGTERPCPPRPGRQRPSATAQAQPRPRLPPLHGWLLKDLKHQAAVYANRLDRLLSEPEAAAIIAHCPQAQRMLRPLCHMLGLRHPVVPPLPRRRPPAPARPGPEPATPPRPHIAEPAPLSPPHEAVPCPDPPWPWLPWAPSA